MKIERKIGRGTYRREYWRNGVAIAVCGSRPETIVFNGRASYCATRRLAARIIRAWRNDREPTGGVRYDGAIGMMDLA